MEVSQTSNDIRLTYKSIRDGISISDRNRLSSLISKNVLALLESDFKGANIFLCFYPFGAEVDLRSLYEELLKRNKELYFPTSNIKEHKLTFYRVMNLDKDFHKGFYDIMEPNERLPEFVNSKEEIISITPGLVFDKKLNRIGYGAGFYDRFLSAHPNILKLAPVFAEQVVESIDVQSHDVPMDIIVTEDVVLKGE